MTEKGRPFQESESSELVRDRLQALYEEHGATWVSPEDPNDPYNWPTARKVTIAIVVSTGQLICLMSTSMMASALPQISRDLGINASTTQITFSLFVLGQAFGPFLIAALSEVYGRKYVWLASCCFFQFWNALCPVGRNKGIMMAGRFLAGCGASAGPVLSTPIMADMYRAEDRGKSLAIASFIPYFGPALGPIVGGLLADHIEWPWLFWVLSIFSAINTVIGIVLLKETYTPVLLQRKSRLANQASGTTPEGLAGRAFYTDLSARLSRSLLRPLVLFVRRPVILVISWIWAISFGLYVLVLSSFASLWMDRYGQMGTQSSLNYFALALGITIATQAGGHLMDWIFRRLRDRAGGETAPEFRAPYMALGVIMLPAGLFWYGWAAEGGMHWLFVDVGAAVFTCGTFVTGSGISAYLVDEFEHAASANAAARMLSNILGFAFPIFAPQLFSQLGYGWGNSLLAFVFMALGLPAPLVIWLWGSRLRSLVKTAGD
ncbi:MFS multidrug transporter [Colletotrichum musicola]|uniref:MFS multidrug transporter n=1 Tax=Colletotrichum musicola TaxID=2175873 RepID=A0A8H6IR67_9PEZI|nr:MFS multidrug transporter [Colletotrichum musicola]